jgi:hypothetical protein
VIPSNSHDGVLPPFVPGGSPHDPASVSPYRVSLMDVAERYATSEHRKRLLRGLVAYRSELRAAGITEGFQWIDGSFVEDCESVRGRPPSDIDIITFSVPPESLNEMSLWTEFFQSRLDLFDPEVAKKIYKCDAYFLDLRVHPIHVVNFTRYFFGLFSHQRETYLWKGMLEIPLDGEDHDVAAFLGQEVSNAS